jgi:hypothetical protein
MTDKRRITFSYIYFYILFSIDTWRILIGIAVSAVLTPQFPAAQKLSAGGEVMLYIMVAGIGWAVAAYPAKKIAFALRKFVLKNDNF